MSLRLLPHSIAGRMALVIIGVVILSHLISLGSYDLDRITVINDEAYDRIGERVASTVRLLERSPAGERGAITDSMSNAKIQIAWSAIPAIAAATDPGTGRELAEDLADWLEIAPSRVRVADRPANRVVIAVQLSDSTWVNAEANALPIDNFDFSSLLMTTLATVIGIILLSLFLVRWVTRPLRRLTSAAERLGTNVEAAPLPEKGPVEVRRAALAFNTMQQRIQRLLTDRTQMFAAISHDLKTPITRVKLRLEFIADESERARIMRDLEDMEQMIGSFLAFLREENGNEETRLADLSTMLQTICDDFSDAGHRVSLIAPQSCPYFCRVLALKRALSNLIDNAIKYGGSADVTLMQVEDRLEIEIADQGPGIAVEEQAKVFEPFYRLETSRNRNTGGTGLGLTIARSIIQAHGGEITLENQTGGGMRAIIELPVIKG
jgi:signal transduction histidine kinase